MKFARDQRIDLVYTSQQRFDCHLGALIARTLDVPHLIHLHYRPGPILRSSTMQHLVDCDAVIAVSGFIRRLAVEAGVDPARVFVVPNTIGPSEFGPKADDRGPAPSESSGVVIGQTGRMSDDKGFTDSVEAFGVVHAARPDTSLLLVGDGDHRPTIERRVNQLRLTDAVRMVGWQADVPAWLERMDIFVHPSPKEPFGLAILEASAHGLPVVALLDGGVSEVVQDGTTGFLVEPGDTEGLAAALLELVDDAELRRRLGTAGRLHAATNFRPSDSGQSCSTILRNLVADRNTRETA